MRNSGFTLLELVCTLAVAGVLLGLGIPSLRHFLLDSRRTVEVNAFVRAIQLARSDAYRHGHPVVLCKTVDQQHCAGIGVRYDAGWMVFVNSDGISPPTRDAGERLLSARIPETGESIFSNRTLYQFHPFRHHSTNGTVTFCDSRGVIAARAVIVSYTGRPRVSKRKAGGQALSCAQ